MIIMTLQYGNIRVHDSSLFASRDQNTQNATKWHHQQSGALRAPFFAGLFFCIFLRFLVEFWVILDFFIKLVETAVPAETEPSFMLSAPKLGGKTIATLVENICQKEHKIGKVRKTASSTKERASRAPFASLLGLFSTGFTKVFQP